MEYLSVKEVADLKGCSERYIKLLAKEGKLKSIQETSCKGRPKYMIPVSTLPQNLQEKYYRQKRTETGILPEKKETEAPDKQALKYGLKGVKRPFNSFSEEERQEIQNWINLLDEWQAERASRKDKTEFDKLFVAHQKYIHPEMSISTDILYRKYTAYQNECYEDLLDKRGGWNRGTSKLPDESPIWQVFWQLYSSENQPTVSQCYRSTVAYFTEEQPELLEQIPNEACFRRKIKTLPFAVLEYARHGEKAMRDHCIPYAQRAYDDIYANDIWIMDNYTIDGLIQSADDPKKTKRMYLTTVLDAKSGVMVGWNVTSSPDSQSTVTALRFAMLRHGFPQYLYFDNGREFTTNDIVGEAKIRKLAVSKKGNLPVTILERLGIKIKVAKPYRAQSKAVERAHRTFKEQFCRGLIGFSGGTIVERPESIKRRIKNGEIETESELRQLLKDYTENVFNVAPYGGAEQKYKGVPKIEVWNSSIAETEFRMASEDVLDLLLMRNTGFQKVKREGVFVNYHGEKVWYYDAQETWKHIGEEVCVRYDPNDLTSVRIYDREDRYLYTWKCADWMLTEYFEEKRENIAVLEQTKSNVEKLIKQRNEELKGKPVITQKEGLAYCARQNKGKFEIRVPKNIHPVLINEDTGIHKMAVGAEDVPVVIDIRKIAENAAKRKGE